VDTQNKRILVGVPMGPAATEPNQILMMDYRGLAIAAEIEAASPVHFSPITKKMFFFGAARKWSPWNVAARSAALIERPDGTAHIFLGNAAANGKIYQFSDTQFTDDGAAINSYYTTAFLLPADLEADLQVRSHRKLFAYLTANVEGAGLFGLTAFLNSSSFAIIQQPLGLSSPAPKDLELPLNVTTERVSFQLGFPPSSPLPGAPLPGPPPPGSPTTPGSWFRLRRLVPSLTQDPWAPVRGVN
jgi:hypothetical protein